MEVEKRYRFFNTNQKSLLSIVSSREINLYIWQEPRQVYLIKITALQRVLTETNDRSFLYTFVVYTFVLYSDVLLK